MGNAATEQWDVARETHRVALDAFIVHARGLGDAEWAAPVAPGKWSPAQIAEHLRLTYTLLAADLTGGQGLRLRTPAWLRPWLRFRYLAPILRTGMLPAGARAPREARPGDGPFPRRATLEALEAAGLSFENALRGRWNERRAAVTHHVFGRIDARQAFRFVAVHTEHHRRQLPG